MARKRDYKAEYARRIARGKARGLSRSQARGHPKANERYASGKPATPQSTEELEAAFRELRAGNSLKQSAKTAGVSEERFRRFVKGNELASYSGRAWEVTDNRPRQVPMIKGSSQSAIIVPDFDTASQVGTYHNAVGRFLRTQQLSFIQPFEGQSVRDIRGREHVFETDPNALFRLAAKDEPEFHEIYQIISN